MTDPVAATSGTLEVGSNADQATLHFDLHEPRTQHPGVGSSERTMLARSAVPAPLFMVMGFGSDGAQWHDQVQHFVGRGHRVLTFDNRGVGRSSVPRGRYTTSRMAADALELMAHVGWTPHNTHLVGVSMGGMIALEMLSG